MERNEKVVAITAAMLEGTGLVKAKQRFPERTYDVGIAEQHAVTFAAGLACEGVRPVVAIYSTFLQRAYDQIIHDVALQKLPVTFALDRGGIVGADGKTHQGAFDLAYLRCVPNLVVMAPSDENELRHMLHTALAHDGPAAFRFPRGAGRGRARSTPSRRCSSSARAGSRARCAGKPDVCVVAIGSTVRPAVAAAEALAASGLAVSVVDARFVKPLDEELVVARGAARGPARHGGGGLPPGRVRLGGARGARAARPRRGGDRRAAARAPRPFVTHGDQAKQRAELGHRRRRHRPRLPRARAASARRAAARVARRLKRSQRVDLLLVERGLAESRTKAQALVMAGAVVVGEARVDKPGALVDPALPIRLKEDAAPSRYVSRGALKLEKALDTFPVDPRGKTCADLGASTGGFTDLLLQRGAAKVYAVDVGYGQLHAEAPRRSARRRARARERAPPRRRRRSASGWTSSPAISPSSRSGSSSPR